MTPEQKNMMVWSGGLAGVLLVGWLVLDLRGEAFATTQKKAAGLIRQYDTSHPAKGKNAIEAKKQIKQALGQQESALTEAESALVPPLPEQFTNPEISAAEGAIREAINQLEQKAQRQNVKLADLPFKNAGLDPKSDVRRMQLAQVYLYCGVLDTCIEAGVNAVSTVRLASSGISDPSDTYALLTCDVELEAKWKGGTNQLIADMLARQNRKGYGVRNLEIAQNEDGTQRVRLTASLLARFDKDWGLKNENGTRPAGAPAAPAPKKSRRSTDDNT